MIQCPLCEALFTRYEIALDKQLDFLIPLYYAALSAHARRPHDFVTTLDVSMYMTTPLAVYHRWLAARGGEEGRGGAMKAEYTREGVILYLGDCLDVMESMDAKSVDHTITDPPYNERTHQGARIAWYNIRISIC